LTIGQLKWVQNILAPKHEKYGHLFALTGIVLPLVFMPLKKYIFGNWTEKWMCGDNRPLNRKTKSDRYPMPMPEELFDALGLAKIFSTLDLRSSYHQLPLLLVDRVKTVFWRIDKDGKDQLYHWKFLPFGMHLLNFSR
jgi:hypothetical protein